MYEKSDDEFTWTRKKNGRKKMGNMKGVRDNGKFLQLRTSTESGEINLLALLINMFFVTTISIVSFIFFI